MVGWYGPSGLSVHRTPNTWICPEITETSTLEWVRPKQKLDFLIPKSFATQTIAYTFATGENAPPSG
jgi:hypothetical protein